MLEAAEPHKEVRVEVAELQVATRGNSRRLEAVSEPIDGDANPEVSFCPAQPGGLTARRPMNGRTRSLSATSEPPGGMVCDQKPFAPARVRHRTRDAAP